MLSYLKTSALQALKHLGDVGVGQTCSQQGSHHILILRSTVAEGGTDDMIGRSLPNIDNTC